MGYVGLVLALPVILFALPAGALPIDSGGKRCHGRAGGDGGERVGLAWAWFPHAALGWIYLFLLGTASFARWLAGVGGECRQARAAHSISQRGDVAERRLSIGGDGRAARGRFLLAWWNPVIVYLIDAASSLVLMTGLSSCGRTRRRWQSSLIVAERGRGCAVLDAASGDDLDDGARHGGRAVWRGHRAAADLCDRRAGRRRDRVRLDAGDAVDRRDLHEFVARDAAADAARREVAVWAVVAFGVATIVFGVSKSFPLSLDLFLLGAADNISVVIRSTVLQLLTPDSMRGRVSAVSVVFIGTSNEIGEFESGVAAQWLGLMPAVVGGGFMTLMTVGVVARIWPELVKLGPLEHLAPPDEVPEVVG